MPRCNNARLDTHPLPAPDAALGLLARLARGPAPLAELRDRDDGLHALAVAQARGLARLALDASGSPFVIRGRAAR
jgi:hypothetical protein